MISLGLNDEETKLLLNALEKNYHLHNDNSSPLPASVNSGDATSKGVK